MRVADGIHLDSQVGVVTRPDSFSSLVENVMTEVGALNSALVRSAPFVARIIGPSKFAALACANDTQVHTFLSYGALQLYRFLPRNERAVCVEPGTAHLIVSMVSCTFVRPRYTKSNALLKHQ